jgi:starch phosphorylase
LKLAIDMINNGFFSQSDPPDLFKPLMGSLLHHDEYMLLADYQSYVDCQRAVSQAYQDCRHWTRASILNVARMGKFSSDRAIRDYCRDIWHIDPDSRRSCS